MLTFKCDHCGAEKDAVSAAPPADWQIYMVTVVPQPTAGGAPTPPRVAQIHACEKPECVSALTGSLFKDAPPPA
jgi:hypothetical protein